jgi:NAD-dependent deacetylase
VNEIEARIEKAIGLLREAQNVVALTGAGISTPSGIPDFRSPGSGMWDQVDPMEVASIYGFRRRPQAFYEWMRPLTGLLAQAQPNPAHIALAQLEAYGPLQSIITQNIDMLHTRAGSKVIHEVHGHMRRATCIQCNKNFDGQPFWDAFMATHEIPACPACSGILKPDVVLFGEMLPFFVMNAAQKAAETCDLMLVVGSSLEVTPVADLPMLTRRTGARLIIVNFTETYADPFADVVIQADVAEVLPRLAAPFLPGIG